MTTGEATAALQSERRASEGAEVNSGRRYALPDVDSLDISQYNEVKLNGSEMARLQSEAMTWDAKHRNTLRTRTLSNGIHYRYYIDNDGIVHCLDREPSQNIHEDRRNYDDRGTEQLDRLAESLRAGQRNDGGNRRSLPDGRESADNDRLDHRKVRSEGESDRGGHPKNGPRTDRNKKAVRYKFDEDGSGHGVTYYSDGTTERFALPDTASAAETAGGETDTSAPKTDTTAPKTESTVREIEAWAKENVKRYGELLPNEKREIRAMVRQARALGIPEADIRRYANLEARTHVRVSFSKDRCFAGTQEDGTRVYADGFYDPDTNEIVVNPEGKRSAARLILHELSHFLYKGKYGKVIDKAVRRMDEARATEVAGRYAKYGIEVASEEVAVHHAEDILGNERNLDRLLRDEPTIGDKILSFFGLARYGDDVRLSRAAGKLLRHFERAMNTASARNTGGLTLETTSDAEGRRYAIPVEGEIVDARTLSEQDVRMLLERVQNGYYKPTTYIPLRIGTPRFIIGVVKEHSLGNVQIEDFPMITDVNHLMQIMDEDDGRDYGNHRPHGLEVDDIIQVLRGIADPKYIVYQNNGRYAAVVSFYNKQHHKVIAVLDFAWQSDGKQHNFKQLEEMNGYNAGLYNVIVTTYKPDDFDAYLANNEIVY
ncbi:MAG: hypothetical protein J6V07_06045, partial [Clostridia bacterium]|nr:hypothetical protein [Clostridia bacterium]